MRLPIATLLILAALSLFASSMGDKEITQMYFISNFSLGRMNELNKTFEAINKKLPSIPDVTY